MAARGGRQEAAAASPRPIVLSTPLPARWRRAVGIAMTSAGAATIVTDAAGMAADPVLAPVGQLLIAVLCTVHIVQLRGGGRVSRAIHFASTGSGSRSGSSCCNSSSPRSRRARSASP